MKYYLDRFVALAVAAQVVVGIGGAGHSSARESHCPQGNYAPQSLAGWFRTSFEISQGRRGPELTGYIYNDYFASAEQILIGIEPLSPSGQAAGCLTVRVGGIVHPRDRAYFVAPVPDASTNYRVRILSFAWVNKGGP